MDLMTEMKIRELDPRVIARKTKGGLHLEVTATPGGIPIRWTTACTPTCKGGSSRS